ncbi:MAG: hypothetical protein PHC51_04320 [bacterium]|nr:hypothetical protein [bacterium]
MSKSYNFRRQLILAGFAAVFFSLSITACQKALPYSDPDSVAQKSSREVQQTLTEVRSMGALCKIEGEKAKQLVDRLNVLEKRLALLEAAGKKSGATISSLQRQLASCRHKSKDCKSAPLDVKEYSPSDAPPGWAAPAAKH